MRAGELRGRDIEPHDLGWGGHGHVKTVLAVECEVQGLRVAPNQAGLNRDDLGPPTATYRAPFESSAPSSSPKEE